MPTESAQSTNLVLKRIWNHTEIVFPLTKYAKDSSGNIISFSYEGSHFHARPKNSSVNHFPTVNELIEKGVKGSAVVAGGIAGANVGQYKGPTGVLVGVAAGSMVALLAEKIWESLVDHKGRIVYIDEDGEEMYYKD